MRARLVLTLALCLGPVGAQDSDPRTRLAEVIQREQRLLDLLRRVREGETVAASELLARPAPLPVRPLREDPESAFERAQLVEAEAPTTAAASRPPVGEVGEVGSATATPSTVAQASLPPLPAEHTDPQRLGDAYLFAGQAVAALDAYERAAERAEAHGTPLEIARARYGVARALEELQQFDAAIEAYAAVEKLPDAGLWTQAATFARTFIRWRRQVADSSPAQKELR
ncbi:MAG: tetratricopeptide repeat protein [Planctomycetes bacterium]|nr:tetratricopeptide repeat protein [Planctomycetota bacterium]